MYHHVKKLMYTVRVGEADPAFGNMLLEQFGGANGELAAAMQYSIQGLNCSDPLRKDMLMDIGTEELSHLEIVGTLAKMHLQPMKAKREAAEADPLVAIAGGGGVCLHNSAGNAWTADYLKITGELDVDLRSNIAAEARAKIVYERLINFCRDATTRDALQFLMTREIAHMKSFAAALDSMNKPSFSIGQIPPSPEFVNKYFNDSVGEGDDGQTDGRGPWNEGNGWEFVDAPGLEAFRDRSVARQLEGGSQPASPTLEEALVDCLQDLLHAEGQLTKALPKMAKSARSQELRESLEKHLVETEGQIERLNEVFTLLGKKAVAKPCKGMAGLITEGQQVLSEGKEKEDAGADLGLIAAARKVEHYEISSYQTAVALASQSGQLEAATLLRRTLLEEEQADKVLNGLATLLMENEALAGVSPRPEEGESETRELAEAPDDDSE